VRHVKSPGIINAWVTARGDIFISEGLINFVDTEDELAFVIAHELAHIENLLPDKKIALRRYIINTVGNEVFGGVVTRLIESLTTSLNQYDELIADRAALYLMYEAKYNPEAALDFFSRLDKVSDDNRSYLMLETLTSTHPYDHIRFGCLSRYLHDSRQKIPLPSIPATKPATNSPSFSTR
jgi:predicted Zn-dependent protease